jgi:alpha-beta hydrolase superfamily lysophospholipase
MKEYSWISESGLKVYAWSDGPEKPKALIMLVHGFGDHSHRYEHVAEYLIARGFGFLALDYYGHGRSEGRRGDIPSYQVLMDDLQLFSTEAEKLYPEIPKIWYGHSLGGNLVLNYYHLTWPKPSAMIITSPWLRLAMKPPRSLQIISNILVHITPGLVIKSPLDSNDLSRSTEIGSLYENDPYVHRKVSVRVAGMVESKGLEAIAKGKDITVPTLLMHGTDDRILSHEASEELARNNPGMITFKSWPGMYHELHNEPEKMEVLQYIATWLEKTHY